MYVCVKCQCFRPDDKIIMYNDRLLGLVVKCRDCYNNK
jgi:hypothetical protein